MSLIVRALRTATFGFSRKLNRNLVSRQELTIPDILITKEVLDGVRTYVAAGQIEVISASPTHGLPAVRPSTARNQLLITLGVDQGSGVLLPNGASLHKINLGGVPFVLGDGHIDGSSTSTLLTAFLAALNASTDLAATGAVVRASWTDILPAAVAATVTLTSDNTAPSDGDTVTIGAKTYTFRTALTPTEGEVLINSTADAALLNLIRAINHTGTPDTDYKCAAAHPTVSAAASVTAHAFLITALTAGSAGNALVSTETSAHLSFGTATLVGGADTVAVVVIDGDDIADFAAFEAASGLTDNSDATITTPYVTLTWLTSATHDTTSPDQNVLVTRTVTSADVTRGYIALDTGLTDLSTKFALRITRSGVKVLHDGTVSILGSRVVLIQNDGSTDFQNGDVLQLFAAGTD